MPDKDTIDAKYSRITIIATAAIALLVICFAYFGYFELVNHSIFFDKLQGYNAVTNNILVIKIDDESINMIGRWPWDRDVYTAIEKLDEASVIAIDVSLIEKSSKDAVLNETLNRLKDKVILVNEIQDKVYLPVFDTKTGYANINSDSDGVVRHPKFDLQDSNSLEQEIYLTYFNKEFSQTEYGKEIYSKNIKPIINYADTRNIPQITFHELYYNKTDISFKDKIVYIGATASDLHDMYMAPIAKQNLMPGVFIHANILNNMLKKDFVFPASKWIVYLLIISLSILFYYMDTTKKNIVALASILIADIFASISLFSSYQILFDFTDIAVLALLLTLSNIIIITAKTLQKKQFISGVFNRYISKDLLEDIMKNPSKLHLGGHKAEIGIMFSDIRNFTSISEKLSPEDLIQFLNTYFKDATKHIAKNKGFVDKFIGDAIMALWSAPVQDSDFAINMVHTTIELKKLVAHLVEHYKSSIGVEFGTGIGINIGEAVVGNLGGEEKINYSAIGDSVNLASRLEGLTKQYGVIVLASESVIEKLKSTKKDHLILYRKLDYVKVKGKNKPIYIYEIMELDKDKTNMQVHIKEQYEKALELYFAQQFDAAYLIFNELYEKHKDKSSLMMCERIVDLKKKTADELKDWDGSYKWESK